MTGQIFTVFWCMGFVLTMGLFIDLLHQDKEPSLCNSVALVWNGATAGGCLALIVLRPFG